MSKADVLQFVTDFAVTVVVDQDEISQFYDELVREIAFKETLTDIERVDIEAGTAVYPFADKRPKTMRALELHIGAGGRIDPIDITSIQSVFGADWRNLQGNPLAYVQEEEDESTFRLVPRPTQDDEVVVIRTSTRETVPIWIELPLAFEILAREFQRESDHQDIAFAQRSRQMALLLFQLVGVNVGGRET